MSLTREVKLYLWSVKGKANFGENIGEKGIPNPPNLSHTPPLPMTRVTFVSLFLQLFYPQRLKAEGGDALFKHSLPGFPLCYYCFQGSGLKDH